MTDKNELDQLLEELGMERTTDVERLIEFVALRSSELCADLAAECPTMREFNVELNDFVDMNADRREAFVDCGRELQEYWTSL